MYIPMEFADEVSATVNGARRKSVNKFIQWLCRMYIIAG